MREYLPYLVLAAVVAAVYLYRNGGLAALRLPAAKPRAPQAAVYAPLPPSGALPVTSSADAFAFAQKLAREEAHAALDQRFAEEARKAAVAIYTGPFSVPPAEDKPAV